LLPSAVEPGVQTFPRPSWRGLIEARPKSVAGGLSLSDEHVERLAKLFDVSVQAMVIRLSSLRILAA